MSCGDFTGVVNKKIGVLTIESGYSELVRHSPEIVRAGVFSFDMFSL